MPQKKRFVEPQLHEAARLATLTLISDGGDNAGDADGQIG
jgi:hypothetical protein